MATGNKKQSGQTQREETERSDRFFGPAYFEPYAIEVARRIDPAGLQVVLELASGTGRVTRHIRERLSDATTFIASDLDLVALDIARDKLAGQTIDWQKIDAAALPFQTESIDLITCSFGYMFVADKERAFSEAWRVLKPGGLLLFTTWDELEKNGASFTAKSLILQYLEKSADISDSSSTSMSDDNTIRSMLQTAGFGTIQIEHLPLSFTTGSAMEAAAGLVEGSEFREEIKALDERDVNELKQTIEIELSRKYGAAPLVAPMCALIVEARKIPVG